MKLLRRDWLQLNQLGTALFTVLLFGTAQAAKLNPPASRPAPAMMHAEPTALDPKLVVYTYDPDYTYPVLTQIGRLTHLEFEEDELIIGIYLADPKSWYPGLTNTATIITNKRRYELMLTPAANQYYQRVSWQHNDNDHLDGFIPEVTGNPESTPTPPTKPTLTPSSKQSKSREPDQASAHLPIDLAHANFDYTVKGKTPFKPIAVFDDSRFTWLKMPPIQEIPAVLILAQDGTTELANFMVQGDYFVIRQILDHGALLKLGKDEIQIYNNQSQNCGFWGCSKQPITNLWEH
ncbi:hypothetical protein BGZ96_003267 [Linnemannia gamsii]|uniref:Uncharacterized protein n=1 Tax=Linnemannia gamsii TaxID=64522 RepID=A0ABQ7K7W5_9FUNG|nr:hypothetical protein BGZ96_003267 [Linnemannia gamsii]